MIGEPSGTAGAPMLSILQKNDLCNILVIVTRYFGGILLGTGGLVRCYSNSTIGAIEKVNLLEIETGTEYKVETKYTEYKNLEYYLKRNNIKIVNINYGENIFCNIQISTSFKKLFLEDIQNKVINLESVDIIKENINIIKK